MSGLTFLCAARVDEGVFRHIPHQIFDPVCPKDPTLRLIMCLVRYETKPITYVIAPCMSVMHRPVPICARSALRGGHIGHTPPTRHTGHVGYEPLYETYMVLVLVSPHATPVRHSPQGPAKHLVSGMSDKTIPARTPPTRARSNPSVKLANCCLVNYKQA